MWKAATDALSGVDAPQEANRSDLKAVDLSNAIVVYDGMYGDGGCIAASFVGCTLRMSIIK